MVKEGPYTLLKVMWSRGLDLVRRRGINTVVEQWDIGLKVLGSQPGFPAGVPSLFPGIGMQSGALTQIDL